MFQNILLGIEGRTYYGWYEGKQMSQNPSTQTEYPNYYLIVLDDSCEKVKWIFNDDFDWMELPKAKDYEQRPAKRSLLASQKTKK